MRLTSSIRLLAMAVLLAAPAAAAASPPESTASVSPLAVKATVMRDSIAFAPQYLLTAISETAAVVLRDTAVRSLSVANTARSGVQTSGAATVSTLRAGLTSRLRPTVDTAVVTSSALPSIVSSRAADPPNRMSLVSQTRSIQRTSQPRHSLRL